MQISNITTGQPYSATESGMRTNPELDKDVAELRRKLISGELSDTERVNVQTLLKQAERALNNGNEEIARQFVNQANETLGDEEPDTSPPAGSAPAKRGPGSPNSENSLKEPDAAERTYQDASNDASVSFKYPTKLNEYQAAVAVPAHENEHVQSAVFEAQNNGVLARVLVRYRYGIDASGKRYLKGGNTYASIPAKNDSHIPGQASDSRIDVKA